jgi:Prealbumin-like fold domain
VTLNAGSYSVDEAADSGYTKTASADCVGTIANGQTKTCTITNDDIQPKLIVIKHVINDNGGTATAASFTMTVTGSSPSPASFPGAESPGMTVMLNAGVYGVSETGPSGYAASFSADCSGTIAVGQIKTCTVTNNDVYLFSGFFSPVDNLPALNLANAGQAIPIKWTITTPTGVVVSDPASFVSLESYQIACISNDPQGSPIEEYAAGSSGLQYVGNGSWQFVWKTPKSYAGTCRMMLLNLNDGTQHTAKFKFK